MSWSRRSFFGGVGLAFGCGLGIAHRKSGPSASLLRPPGAKRERDFLAACLRCGQCVEACLSDTLRLATTAAGLGRGTPHVVARETPCDLCADHDDLRCIAACPSGALESVATVADVRMGTAIIDTTHCLAFNGTTCRACWHACPLPGDALGFDALLRPVVREDHCVGCGLCEYVCLTEPTSIAIQPKAAGERTPRVRKERR